MRQNAILYSETTFSTIASITTDCLSVTPAPFTFSGGGELRPEVGAGVMASRAGWDLIELRPRIASDQDCRAPLFRLAGVLPLAARRLLVLRRMVFSLDSARSTVGFGQDMSKPFMVSAMIWNIARLWSHLWFDGITRQGEFLALGAGPRCGRPKKAK
jgi:hypothetical protein